MTSGDASPDVECAGFVLAGGRSSRMGTDKALLLLDGKPLIAHTLGIVREAGLTPSIAGGRVPLDDFAPVIADDGQGPLSGICAALTKASPQISVFLPVDMPLLPASLIAAMIFHAQTTGAAVTVPSVSGFAETFPAVVDRAALPRLQASLARGERGCFAAFQAAAAEIVRPFRVVPVELLVQAGQVEHPAALPPALWFLNVNSPADLARAEHFFAASHRPPRIA